VEFNLRHFPVNGIRSSRLKLITDILGISIENYPSINTRPVFESSGFSLLKTRIYLGIKKYPTKKIILYKLVLFYET